MSHLDYANSLYQGLPEVTLRKLQMVQNMAAKLAPTYLIDLIKEQPINRQGLLSASRLHHLQIPATKRKVFADLSFSVSGPRL